MKKATSARAAIGVAFALSASGASAQIANMSRKDKALPPVSYEQSEQINQYSGVVSNFFQSAVECGKVASLQAGLAEDAAGYAKTATAFERIGLAFTLATASNQFLQGKATAGTQTLGEAAIDYRLCAEIARRNPVTGAAFCAGWTTGRTIGTLIDQLPWDTDAHGKTRSVEDAWTDALAGALLPVFQKFRRLPLTHENYRLLIQAARQKEQEARAHHARLEAMRSVCLKKEAKSELEKLLENAKANAKRPLASPEEDGGPTDAVLDARNRGPSHSGRINGEMIDDAASAADSIQQDDRAGAGTKQPASGSTSTLATTTSASAPVTPPADPTPTPPPPAPTCWPREVKGDRQGIPLCPH